MRHEHARERVPEVLGRVSGDPCRLARLEESLTELPGPRSRDDSLVKARTTLSEESLQQQPSEAPAQVG